MKPFWEGARDGRFRIQRCHGCNESHFPAVDVCTKCLGADLEWIDAKGTGEVFSFVVMHQIYHPYFADRVPYAVVDVKLDEGPHLLSSLAGVAPQDVRIGERVRVEFEPVDDEIALPVFRRNAA
jgi:uncharacterized OB-fold protein